MTVTAIVTTAVVVVRAAGGIAWGVVGIGSVVVDVVATNTVTVDN